MEHQYSLQLTWTGNTGSGTSSYRAYGRDYILSQPGKPDWPGSADPTYRGDPARHNPEDMLVASLSACHMLWYLHLCADAGIVVLEYADRASGSMQTDKQGSGAFSEVILHPEVVIADGAQIEVAHALHQKAHSMCFIARSVNFPVRHMPEIRTKM